MRSLACCGSIVLLLGLAGVTRPQPAEPVLVDDFEDSVSTWSGLVPDAEIVHTGRGAGKWSEMWTNEKASLKIADAWGNCNALEMWLHSEAATNAPFVIVLFADNAETRERDCYVFKAEVDWTGWRLLFLPQNLFRREGEPLAWDHVDELRLSAIGWGCTPTQGTVLRVDDVYVSRHESTSPDVLSIGDMEYDVDLWFGLKPSTAYAKGGESSGKWNMADEAVPYVKCQAIPHDWSLYHELHVWAYSPKPTGTKAKVILYSAADNDWTAGYWTSFEVDWAGWRELVFPRWAFFTWKEPVGWHKIDALVFTARKWGLPGPSAGAVLHLDNVTLQRIGQGRTRVLVDDFECGTETWSQLTTTQAHAHSGAKSGLITGSGTSRFIQTWKLPSAWEPYDALELWVHSENGNGAILKILVDADNDATPNLNDYYLAAVAVDWTGWRRLQFRKSSFSEERVPGGWNAVQGLIIAGGGFGLVAPPGTSICVDDISLVKLEEQTYTLFEDFEEGVGNWQGLEQCAYLSKSGGRSGVWRISEVDLSVHTTDVPEDWSEWDALRIWVYSAKTTNANVRIEVQSDSPATTDLIDCYTLDFSIDWEGWWKELHCRRGEFGATGEPVGWHNIQGLSLRALDDAQLAFAGTELALDDLALVGTGAPPGSGAENEE